MISESVALTQAQIYVDIVIKGSLPKCQDLLDRVQLSTQLLVGGEVIDETKPVGNEPTQAVWRLNNSIKVCVVFSFRCLSSTEYLILP
jgi:hypothetical protein